MEREFTCKKLEVTYGEEKMFLSGPHCAEIRTEQDIPITITVNQCGMRTITIVAEKEITQAKMYGILTQIERLLMLFDGWDAWYR